MHTWAIPLAATSSALSIAFCLAMTRVPALPVARILKGDALRVAQDNEEREHWWFARSEALTRRSRMVVLLIVMLIVLAISLICSLPSRPFALYTVENHKVVMQMESYPSGHSQRTRFYEGVVYGTPAPTDERYCRNINLPACT